MKKRVTIILVTLAITGVLFVIYNQREKDDSSVRTAGVVAGIEVNLASKVQGRISEICCDEGDSVKEGQVAVRLESNDLHGNSPHDKPLSFWLHRNHDAYRIHSHIQQKKSQQSINTFFNFSVRLNHDSTDTLNKQV